MTVIPTYKAAVVGGPGNAGMSNQFLVPHTGNMIFNTAAVQSSQTIGDSNYTTTQDQYLAQQFVTGVSQTTISEVWVQVSVVGGSAVTSTIDPLTVSIYADSGGEPSGSSLGSGTLSETAVYLSGFWVVIPVFASGLDASTTYHLVISSAGTSTTYYVWQNNNQPSGGSISPDLAAWTDQAFGFMYKVYDSSTTGGSEWVTLVEDGGSRRTTFGYSGTQVSSVTEYTVNQIGTDSVTYSRSLTYSGTLLTGIN